MSSLSVRIRPASKKDLPALVNLEQIAFQKDAFKPRRIRYLLNSARSSVFVLEHKKEIIGAAYLLWHKNRHNGRIYNIVISPKLQGKGLGAKLLRKCEQECRKRRCGYVSLEVRIDNKPAIAFYKKHGFEITGKLPDYYDDDTAGFRLRKKL
ncbi:MAG: ribosomal protein S18-alanine N-acetyltransferase [Candidatus Zixiibacteriota bacterium]